MTKTQAEFLGNSEAISQLLGRSPHRVAAAIERRGVEPVATVSDQLLFDARGLKQIEDSLNTTKRKCLRITPRNRSPK